MATTKIIKTNKFGEIEITATSEKREFRDDLYSVRGTYQTRKVWNDTNGNAWVKYQGQFHMLSWIFGSAFLPMDYSKNVFGWEC
jgi:hypothetical protein